MPRRILLRIRVVEADPRTAFTALLKYVQSARVPANDVNDPEFSWPRPNLSLSLAGHVAFFVCYGSFPVIGWSEETTSSGEIYYLNHVTKGTMRRTPTAPAADAPLPPGS